MLILDLFVLGLNICHVNKFYTVSFLVINIDGIINM